MEISGAAVSKAEDTRLKQFLPMPGQHHEQIVVRLKQLKAGFQKRLNEIKDHFSPDLGYNEIPGLTAPTNQEAGGDTFGLRE